MVGSHCISVGWFMEMYWPMVTVFASGLSNLGFEPLYRNIMLCSCARHFTLKVLLSTQMYRWVLLNLMLGIIPTIKFNNPAMDQHPPSLPFFFGGRVRLHVSCLSRGSRSTPSQLMLQKLELNICLMGHMDIIHTLFAITTCEMQLTDPILDKVNVPPVRSSCIDLPASPC